jgi:hypothetical protein
MDAPNISKYDVQHAQRLIELGQHLRSQQSALKCAQSILCEKWYAYIESDKADWNFISEIDDAIDLFIEFVAHLRNFNYTTTGDTQELTVTYGCGHSKTLVSATPEPTKKPSKAKRNEKA